MDGELFLVRHLFILKEITNGLDLVQRVDASSSSLDVGGGMTGWLTSSKQVSLSAVLIIIVFLRSETLASVLNRTSALLPSALFVSLGMPRADESIGDAKTVRLFSL